SRLPVNESDLSVLHQIFRNSKGELFENNTDAGGLGDCEFTIGCTAGDYDNDGFVDLFIANYGAVRAYRNNGDGTFSEVTDALGLSARGMNTSLALADLDRDGDLDLYVVRYLAEINRSEEHTSELQ